MLYCLDVGMLEVLKNNGDISEMHPETLQKSRSWHGSGGSILFFRKQVICSSLCMLGLQIPPRTIDDSAAAPNMTENVSLSTFLWQQNAYRPGSGPDGVSGLCDDPLALWRTNSDDEGLSIVSRASTFSLCQSIKARVERWRDQHEPASLTRPLQAVTQVRTHGHRHAQQNTHHTWRARASSLPTTAREVIHTLGERPKKKKNKSTSQISLPHKQHICALMQIQT